jgi:hypothetical protein
MSIGVGRREPLADLTKRRKSEAGGYDRIEGGIRGAGEIKIR